MPSEESSRAAGGGLRENDVGVIARALERLGWGFCPDADAGRWLDGLLARWHDAVPFENVSRLARGARHRRRSDDPAAAADPRALPRPAVTFWREHLARGAGGTCFDLIMAARRLFRALGIRAVVVGAEVPGPHPGRHVALRVEMAAGAWLVDPGWPLPMALPLHGRRTIRASHPWYDIEFRPDVESLTGVEPREWLLFTEDHRGRTFRYRLRDRPLDARALRAAWRAAGAPDAPYMRRLALGRYEARERRIYHPTGRVMRLMRDRQLEEPIDDRDAAALASAFGLPADLVTEALVELDRTGRRGVSS